MSVAGQSRRFDPLQVTSGLTRTTDVNRLAPLVRFVPEAVVNRKTRARIAPPQRARIKAEIGEP